MARSLLRLALPKGRLQAGTAALAARLGWDLDDYSDGSRRYRFSSNRFPYLQGKVFHEKDIPVQVAVGNYDLGICGLDWMEEYRVKYPASALVKVRDLGYGQSQVVAAVSASGGFGDSGVVRLASEYPNVAERLALELRLRRFSIFPLWGGAEAYPPENADLVLISQGTLERPPEGLLSLGTVLSSSACLIANRDSWEAEDMGEILGTLERAPTPRGGRPDAFGTELTRRLAGALARIPAVARKTGRKGPDSAGTFWLGLPDGHQQPPTAQFLDKAGVGIEGYSTGSRRQKVARAGVACKVIRPQDLPLQVANGNFAAAITGQDWLREHRCQFPTSPVEELLTLGFGLVRVVAVVKGDLPVAGPAELRQWMKARGKTPLRIASEYVNIADSYARENHLSPYRVIPTWGATEAFLPEDADLLIENTQTGKTLAEHKLKIIDTLFESSACLIGNVGAVRREGVQRGLSTLVEALRRGLSEEAQ
ncbi:MAG: hisG [Dehalococcoidia bacterium]|nr:hisG [Dehalococcoidia bacterium]